MYQSLPSQPIDYLKMMGDIVEFKWRINLALFRKEIQNFSEDWKQYNPRKPWIKRQGIAIVSHDGTLSGIPDLDSLVEYNKETGEYFTEMSFSTPTRVFHEITSIHPVVKAFPQLARSHIIKMDAGGFFPPHRDGAAYVAPTCFRIIAPLTNCEKNKFVFLFEDQRVMLEPGHVYFVNTYKVHSVFSFTDNCTLMVLNVPLTEENVRTCIDHMDPR